MKKSWCRTPYDLLHDARLKDADVLLYAVLLDYSTDFVCTFGVKEIIAVTGGRFSQRTIFTSLTRLEQYGYLTRSSGKAAGSKNVYMLADVIGIKRQRRQPQHAEPEQGQQEIKLRYGQYQRVELTMEQYDTLVHDLGEAKTHAYIKRCDTYMQQHGKAYADCDAVIRAWAAEDDAKRTPDERKAEERKARIAKYLDLVN